MLKIQAPNPPVLPQTKSALASTRAIPHCQHPTFAHPGRIFSTLSIFFWLGDTAVGVNNLLAHALALKATISVAFFKWKQRQGKLDQRQGMALLSCVIVTRISVVFLGGYPIKTQNWFLPILGIKKHQFETMWLALVFGVLFAQHLKMFSASGIPSMPPIECSQQMLGYGGPSPQKF